MRIIREAKRFNVADCGRRFGKTILGEHEVIEPVIEGYPAAWFSPTYKMLTEVWRDLRRILLPVTSGVDKQQHRIETVSGGVLDMWSLDTPNTARGRKYRRVIVDEAAMVKDLADAWQAVIRPTLADLRGDAWILSTPKGLDEFKRMFDRGQDPIEPEWASWQLPTGANPYIDPDEIEAMRRSMPERTFAQEVLAEFLDDAGGVFRGVDGCAVAPWPAVHRPRTAVIGVDWAKVHDFTVLVAMDADTREVIDFDRFNQVDWEVQRRRLRTMAERWHASAILAERNSIGDPNIEALQRDGLPVSGFTTTHATKVHLVEALAHGIETGALSFPPLPELVSELKAFEMERLPSGLVRYGAPAGMHDDCVIALGLAYLAVERGESAVYDRTGRRIA